MVIMNEPKTVEMNDGYMAGSGDCFFCKNRLKGKFDSEGRPYCKAFGIIPLKIWTGEISHRKPINGDNGIQFEDIRK